MRYALRIFAVCLTAAVLAGLCACASPPEAENTAPAAPTQSAAQPDGGASSDAPEPPEEPEASKEPEAIPLGEDAAVGELAWGREVYEYRRQRVSRLYYYYIPSEYQRGEKLPLMLTLHGSGSNAATQLQWGQWVECAQREGFIVVCPESVTIHKDGTLSSEGKSYMETKQADFSYIRWNAAATDPCAQYLVDDVQYLCDLVDLFVDCGYADPDRVYCCGFSHGGFMSMRLALEAPEKFAGVGVVSGLLCAEYAAVVPSEQVKIVFVQGTEDPVVPIEGMHYDFDNDGTMEYTWAYSLDESIAWWLDRYGLPDAPVHTQLPDTNPYDGTSITRDEYAGEDGTVRLVKYVVEGGGHTWPGGAAYAGSGPVSLDAQASELIWAELKDAVRADR